MTTHTLLVEPTLSKKNAQRYAGLYAVCSKRGATLMPVGTAYRDPKRAREDLTAGQFPVFGTGTVHVIGRCDLKWQAWLEIPDPQEGDESAPRQPVTQRVADPGPVQPGPTGTPATRTGEKAPTQPAQTRPPKNPASTLRKLADGLQSDIDRRRGCHAHANLTRKRLQEQESAFKEADRLERIQFFTRRLADLHDCGTANVAPAYITGLVNLRQAELLDQIARKNDCATGNQDPWLWHWDTFQKEMQADNLKRLNQVGIHTEEDFVCARIWIADILESKGENLQALAAELNKREKELVLQGIPGFFPTPPDLVRLMVDHADLHRDGLRILEPSAGSGAIADAIQTAIQVLEFATLTCLEVNYNLYELLRAKSRITGYTVEQGDFLEMNPAALEPFDRILMNPPFEKGQDMAHIRHAYTFLAAGGRLVALCSDGAFYRSDNHSRQFQAFLAATCAKEVEVPADAFKSSLRSTGIKVRMLVIDKPTEHDLNWPTDEENIL